MLRRPPRSTRTDTPFPSRLSADCAHGQRLEASKVVRQVPRQRVAAADGAVAVERSDQADPQCRTATRHRHARRSEEHKSELQSLMPLAYDVFCLQKKNTHTTTRDTHNNVSNCITPRTR